jgi:glycosyltransferase involved in cell wall biosynthesis
MAARADTELHLFPVEGGLAHEALHSVTIHVPSAPTIGKPRRVEAEEPAKANSIRMERVYPTLAELGGEEALRRGILRLGESPQTAPLMHGPGVLASVIRRVQPDLIHSLEFQHAGYLVLETKKFFGPEFPSWLATNWGSDIHYYRRFEDHRTQIKRLLANIDLYSCECERDVGLARELGYQGPVLPVLPNSAGFCLKQIANLRSPDPPSKRRLLMIKGYEHFAGRATVALKVLERFADRLKDYKIILYSVSEVPLQRAKDLLARGVLNIQIVSYASHEEMLEYFGRARAYMGISLSDAISTSVLEAMAMGAFPIQTDTSCCREWFVDGEGGFTVPPDDFEHICARFIRALEDDALVDKAAEINLVTVKARLDSNVVKRQVAEFYDQAFLNAVKPYGESCEKASPAD